MIGPVTSPFDDACSCGFNHISASSARRKEAKKTRRSLQLRDVAADAERTKSTGTARRGPEITHRPEKQNKNKRVAVAFGDHACVHPPDVTLCSLISCSAPKAQPNRTGPDRFRFFITTLQEGKPISDFYTRFGSRVIMDHTKLSSLDGDNLGI